jgi:hypothetical protein
VAVQLGIDAKKSDQVVRGAVVMPNGTGKTKRVAVFAQGAKAEEAKAAGADIVGMDDLAAEIKAGKMDFDVVIASPDTMRVVGTLGQILGPRGLMPNPKVGTVTPDVARRCATPRPARCSSASTRPASSTAPSAVVRSTTTSWWQPACADRRPEQGQAGQQQGHLPAQGGGVVDDGRGRPRGHPVDRRAGRGVTRKRRRDRLTGPVLPKRLVGCCRQGRQAIQDRWWGRDGPAMNGLNVQRRWRSRCEGCSHECFERKVADSGGPSAERSARGHNSTVRSRP